VSPKELDAVAHQPPADGKDGKRVALKRQLSRLSPNRDGGGGGKNPFAKSEGEREEQGWIIFFKYIKLSMAIDLIRK
jgi:hypothetical protein